MARARDILVRFNGGFDIVIANPPYINIETIPEKDRLVYKTLFSCFVKRADIYSNFIENALLTLSNDKGVVTFIVPSPIHSNLSYHKLRDLFLNNHWLDEVCYTGGDIFDEPTVDTTILRFNKSEHRNISLKYAVDFNNPVINNVSIDYFEKFNNIISVSSDYSCSIMDKVLSKEFDLLDEHFTVFQGIVTGNNPAFVFDSEDEALQHGIDKSLLKPLCHGRDIEKYKIRSRDRRILYINNDIDIDDYLNTKEWLLNFKEELDRRNEGKHDIISWCSLHRPRVKTELDIKEKILVQNTRNEALRTRICATIDDSSVYATQGINFIIPKSDKYPLPYLLGILNSSLINYLFATQFLNLAIKAEYLKQLRIPTATPEQQQPIIDLVNQILAAKQNNPQADTSALERRIDALVYQLYGLTEDEIRVIEG